MTTAQVARVLGITWEGTHGVLRKMENCARLPIFQKQVGPHKLWVANYHPHDWERVGGNPGTTQRGALAAHRLIVRGLWYEGETFTREDLLSMLSITPDTATRILGRLGDRGGIPVYPYRGRWHIDLCQFDAISRPNKREYCEGACGILHPRENRYPKEVHL